MIEIERKFRLDAARKKRLEERLARTAEQRELKRQIDCVFLHNPESFKGFKQGMPVVRIRHEGDVSTFTYKRRLNDSGDMLEYEMIISDASAMQSVLVEMGYNLVVIIDKQRREYKISDMTYALDSVQGLGDFLEIEVLAESSADKQAAEQRIMVAAAELGLGESDLEVRKYDQMLQESKA